MLVFRKVAWSCSLTKKLLKILKVAKTLLSRIWKGRAYLWRQVRWRLGRGILVHYTYMTCWSTSRVENGADNLSALVEKFDISLSSCCHYLLNSKSNRERWELSFLTVIIGWVFFLLFLAQRIRRKSLSIQTTEMKPADHAYFGRDEFTSCQSLIYLSFRPQKLNLCNNSTLTEKIIENCQFRRVTPQLHHLIAWEESKVDCNKLSAVTHTTVKAFPSLTKPW